MSNLRESQQYRCVVSNEAGGTRSNVATITVLSKLVNYHTIVCKIFAFRNHCSSSKPNNTQTQIMYHTVW